MTVEEAGTQSCSICEKLEQCRYVYAFDRGGLPIKEGLYGTMFCDGCWADIDTIKRFRIENPYNGRVRCSSEGSSHPCIACGTYIDNCMSWCPGDKKCFRRAKKLGLCVGECYQNTSNWNHGGIHEYGRIENDCDDEIMFVCEICNHSYKTLKRDFYPDFPVTSREDNFRFRKMMLDEKFWLRPDER